jgi:HK97 family phage major capsid protein
MPYNSLVTRTDAAALIPEQSAAMSLFRRRTMARAQQRMPALAAMPVAYFVGGDTGLKQTSMASWENVYLNAEEIAVIVAVPDAVLEDAAFNIWDEMEPLLREAIGRTLDAAIFFGTDKPASWPEAIVPAAVAAGNVVERGTNNAAAGGIAEDLNDLFASVEADGYDVNGLVASRVFRSYLRGARDTSGQRLLDVTNEGVEGIRVQYAMSGMWPTGVSAAELIAGDFQQGILAIRRDITIDRSNQAVITDNTGAIVYNLFQQDMTAVRVTFRAAWAVPNPINRQQPTDADRYPFAVLRSPAA